MSISHTHRPMQANSNMKFRLNLLLSLAILIFAFVLFLPGIPGFYILDDSPNLEGLANIKDFFGKNFWYFVTHGQAGPTGRPISLLTFALQYQSWPMSPDHFKWVNILLHICNATLIGIFFYQFSKYILPKSCQYLSSFWLGFILSVLWLFHPINTNTVLYVVQRMALLSSFFVLLSLNFYGLALLSWSKKPRVFYVCWFVAVCVTPLLAIFSKENGALVFVYLALLEWLRRKNLNESSVTQSEIPKLFFNVTLFLPAMVILIYIVFGFPHWLPMYETRDFTLGERLLTQSRVMWSYVIAIFAPIPSYFSIIGQDDVEISQGLLFPRSTLVSILAWMSLGFLMFIGYKIKRYKHFIMVSIFCWLWFIFGHSLESSTIPLEMVFDHRNYLPSVGLLIFVVLGINYLTVRWGVKGGTILFLIISIYYYGLSYANIGLWKNPIIMGAVTIEEHPKSKRAYEFLIGAAISQKEYELGLKVVNLSKEQMGFGDLVSINEIQISCELGISLPDIKELVYEFESQKLSSWIFRHFDQFIVWSNQKKCPGLTHEYLESLLRAATKNKKLGADRYRAYAYLSHIAAVNQNTEKVYENLDKAAALKLDSGIFYFGATYALSMKDAIKARLYYDKAHATLDNSGSIDPEKVAKLEELSVFLLQMEAMVEDTQ